MQLSSIRSKLIGLLLSAVPLSLSLVIGDSTSIGTGLLTLLDTQNLSPFSGSPSAHCKDPDDPYPFVNSLNHTLPILPNISTSFLESVGINPEEKSYPFDCEIALPGGYISFEIKGEIFADLSLVFQVTISILFWDFVIGPYECNLLELDKKPCTFDIHVKVFDGQGGLYQEANPDPTKVNLCFKVYGTLKIPYRPKKNVYYEHCFYTFPKPAPGSKS